MPSSTLFHAATPAQILAALPPEANEQAEHQWLNDALAWIKSIPVDERTEQLQQLTDALKAHPFSEQVQARLQKLWQHHSSLRLLTEAGLPDETAFFYEFSMRVSNAILPRLIPPGGDLYAMLDNLGLSYEDAGWLVGLPPGLALFWTNLLAPSDHTILSAARMLAIRAASLGLAQDIMRLKPEEVESKSPFFRLVKVADDVAAAPADALVLDRWNRCYSECREAVKARHEALEVRGVSTNMVFRLELVSALLNRIDTLFLLVNDTGRGRIFAFEIVGGFAEHRGLMTLLRRGSTHLARKIVEQTGRVGGHYIAGSSQDWRHMGIGAIGAGLLTAFTALIKYAIGSTTLAPAIAGLAYSLNYSFFFILMQFLHFPLASKMPAMTASALADALGKHDGEEEEIRIIAALTRTQFVVTIGNLIGTIPMALLIDLLWQLRYGHPYLTTAVAEHGLHSVHPIFSWTIVFALLTGASLWLASLSTGATANWVTFRGLPEAITQSRRIRSSVGDAGASKLAHFTKAHLSGVVGYLILGLLLGFVPMFAKFLGINYEVRHVTLAAASIAYDWASLFYAHHLTVVDVLISSASFLLIGLCNFSASFALGLWLALRSRGISRRGRAQLRKSLFTELTRRPGKFFFPPKDKRSVSAAAAAH